MWALPHFTGDSREYLLKLPNPPATGERRRPVEQQLETRLNVVFPCFPVVFNPRVLQIDLCYIKLHSNLHQSSFFIILGITICLCESDLRVFGTAPRKAVESTTRHLRPLCLHRAACSFAGLVHKQEVQLWQLSSTWSDERRSDATVNPGEQQLFSAHVFFVQHVGMHF